MDHTKSCCYGTFIQIESVNICLGITGMTDDNYCIPIIYIYLQNQAEFCINTMLLHCTLLLKYQSNFTLPVQDPPYWIITKNFQGNLK